MVKSAVELPVRVLATRPQAQNKGWCALLRKAGLETLPLPVLALEPVQEPRQREAIKNLILNFNAFDKVIFVSQNAVEQTLVWLDEYWPQLPVGIGYFAVGTRTAALLAERGLAATSGEVVMDSDELLAMPPMQDVQGQKVLICRGCGGRPRLGEELSRRGAQVRYAELYQRVLPQDAAEKLQQSDFLAGGYDEIAAAFSGESLLNLVKVLQQQPHAWAELPVIVPGKRVTDLALEQGFARVVTAENATDEAMLRALQRWLQGGG